MTTTVIPSNYKSPFAVSRDKDTMSEFAQIGKESIKIITTKQLLQKAIGFAAIFVILNLSVSLIPNKASALISKLKSRKAQILVRSAASVLLLAILTLSGYAMSHL